MFETVPIERVNSPHGEKGFENTDGDWVHNLIDKYNKKWEELGFFEFKPILITKDYKIIDGHHSYLFQKSIGKKEVSCIKFDCWFEDTEKLRDFQKHLKGMVPEDFDPKTLKDEFEEILSWLLSNVSK